MAATLGASFVQSRLDYSNSIVYGMSASNMHKLQSAQILSLVWFCLLFAIFQQVSDLVTPTGWNWLELNCSSLYSFKRHLKSHLIV